MRSIKMFFQPPLQGFLLGVLFVVLALPVPDPIAMITRDLGRVTSPLALVFIGMTIQHIGFEKIKHIPKEVWLILFSCFVLRPVVMYFATVGLICRTKLVRSSLFLRVCPCPP